MDADQVNTSEDMPTQPDGSSTAAKASTPQKAAKPRARKGKSKDVGTAGDAVESKRRCVSTACIACRRRKSKCDGNLPACAACSSVYNTECVYDPNSDHRRKGVYKKDIDKLKTRNSTLEVLIQAILNVNEDELPALIKQIRTCESLDTVAEDILAKEAGEDDQDEELEESYPEDGVFGQGYTFEGQLSGKMGSLQLDEDVLDDGNAVTSNEHYASQQEAVVSWTSVTHDPSLVTHLINMYFTWHYTYFTTLSKTAFYREFLLGKGTPGTGKYCSSLLVNAMLALGCHFTSWPAAREDKDDSATAGDHFFKEAKHLIMANDEHEHARITTVQALALMSVREAGCGREAKGWVYSGMSFRMACDLGLNLDSGTLAGSRDSHLDDEEVDARRVTFWGCFLFDKCWSNYLGRLPQLPQSIITVPKFDVFPMEESDIWAACTDSGVNQSHAQPSRTRTVALQISSLCEISSDLMNMFYNPIDIDKSKGKQAELKKLSDIHQRLETWRRNLPQELEPKEGGLPSMLVMHMFFQLLYIHLFRPFLKYSRQTSPLPANVSPRRLCTQAAAMISKLMRLYKRSHGLRQICNIAVYILHTACTIHLLNLPDKNARRDITHGVKHLEEIAEGWLCARRTLAILNVISHKWKVELPEEAQSVLQRTNSKYGAWGIEPPKTPSQKAESVSPISSPERTVLQPPPHYFQSIPTTGMGDINPARNTPPLPPKSIAELQQHVFSPTSAQSTPQAHPPTSRSSLDSGVTAAGASPSSLFGGVEQLLRDSQDWWMRDQSQLAMGFEQWPMLDTDWVAGATSPPLSDGVNSTGMTPYATNVNSNGGAAYHSNGMNGAQLQHHGYGHGIQQYPSEHDWYL